MGIVYAVTALAAGTWFVYETHRLYGLAIRHENPSPMRVFHGSITYLSLLFLAVAIDPLLPF
jgi:protoheme IX farnesyltransferase